ncbi:PDR/VanB family oxidoreductase [Corynebacterium kefirresidentii]|uniref:PDR/VanB family oxidoreductase n=1 Tax=Corynebacterium kefirresidentii TaxID=1979527 RepID=UPI000B6F702C|nr:PDR/VanB family oxidoreductase [Corynebacterium kefirresidentii]OUJ21905.1 phthalate 4,5-dioxygenase [Corynebacterium kefirresidentii]
MDEAALNHSQTRDMVKKSEVSRLRATALQVTPMADDLMVLEFRLTDGEPLPEYSPGCHVDVTLTGPEDTELVRQYSVFEMPSEETPCGGAGADSTYGIAVKREENSRGGSLAMMQLRAGDEFLISPAHNNFELVDTANYYVLAGAGVGIAPMLSMAQSLQRQGKPFMVLYFASSLTRAALLPQLRSICGESLIEVFGSPRARQEEIYRHLLSQAPQETEFYVCGPQGFMSAAKEIVLDYLPHQNFHWENFHPDVKALSGEKNAGAGDCAFDVEFCGETVHVAANVTVLEALEEADLPVMSRCLEGTCSTCVMKVIEGKPDHRDSVFNEQMHADGAFAPCVSRSLDRRLVLERWRR